MRPLIYGATCLVAVLFLAACGGGGGGGGQPVNMDPDPDTMDPDHEEAVELLPFPLGPSIKTELPPQSCLGNCPYHYAANFESIPRLTEEDARRSPVYSEFPLAENGAHLRPRLFVGIHQGDEHLGQLPSVGKRGNTQTRYGRLNDGVGAAAVEAYLEAGLLSDGLIRRHASPPTLLINGTVEAEDFDFIVRAVQLVNAALPTDWQISMLPDNGSPNSVSIEVDVIPSLATGAGVTHYYVDGSGTGRPSLDRARIEIDRNVLDPVRVGERLVQQVLVHEIIHALGVLDHLPTSFDTVMEANNPGPRQGIDQPLSILYPADREALRALYSRLNNGDTPEAGLGNWSSTSLHIAGNSLHANFGVALRNGYAEPWAHGLNPGEFCCDYDLADNPDLSGSATWIGELFGFAPDAAIIAGDAAISVNLTSMTGRANFTDLETWGAGAAPSGGGSQWLDGDLEYAISVRGNTFRETGGDAGRLTGIFTGQSHEGAAGTLERSDLTAAFGASR